MSEVVKNFLKSKKIKQQDALKGKDGVNGRDGKDGVDGKDGLSIKGDAGLDGKDGRDGFNGKDGKDGLSIKGDKGDKGDDGVSIVDSKINGQGELVLNYSDGRVDNVGRVRGYDGVSRGGSGGSGAAIKYINENIETRLPNSVKLIRKQSDFGDCVDGVITLGDFNYIVDATVVLTCRFNILEGGIVAFGTTHKYKNFLVYAGSDTLFTGNPQRLEIKDLVIAGNATATLFNITGAAGVRSTLLWDTCLFTLFGTLGTVTDILTFAAFNPDVTNMNAGLIFNNTIGEPDFIWTGGRIGNETVVTGAMTAITLTGLVGLVNINGVQVRLNTDQYAFKFDNSLNIIDDVEVSNCPVNTSGGGALIDPTGKEYDDVDVTLSGNASSRNSAHVGGYVLATNTTATVISTADTYTSSGLSPIADATDEGFTVSGSIVTSTAKQPNTKTVSLTGNISMASGSSKVVKVGVFLNNTLQYEAIVAPDPTGTKTGLYVITLSLFIEKDDTIEVKYKNMNDTTNLIIENETLTIT
jgi:hypothetical protein